MFDSNFFSKYSFENIGYCAGLQCAKHWQRWWWRWCVSDATVRGAQPSGNQPVGQVGWWPQQLRSEQTELLSSGLIWQ